MSSGRCGLQNPKLDLGLPHNEPFPSPSAVHGGGARKENGGGQCGEDLRVAGEDME